MSLINKSSILKKSEEDAGQLWKKWANEAEKTICVLLGQEMEKGNERKISL